MATITIAQPGGLGASTVVANAFAKNAIPAMKQWPVTYNRARRPQRPIELRQSFQKTST